MAEVHSRLDGKFARDTAWNYAAFGVMAATGVVLNFFIAGFFGIATLGVFNQIYAVYVVTAQLAAFGIHDSAQKHNAEFADDANRLDLVTVTAAGLALATGAVTAALVFALAPGIGRLAESPAVGQGVALAAPGLLFFAVNKVLMGALNGRRRMKAFALAQGFRVLAILAVCLAVAGLGLPGYALGASFTVAEVLLAPALAWTLRPPDLATLAGGGAEARAWLGRHLSFGARALTNGFLAESYIRVDIVMLGIFVSDHNVGIYSFAALFVEGLYQIPVVVRTIVNPVLVRLLGVPADVPPFARKVAALSALLFAAAAAAVLIVYPYLAPLFPAGLVADSFPLLAILVCGLGVYTVFIPVDHILLQAGQPGRQSVLMSLNVLANVALNLALIPWFGIYGAAAATAAAFVCSSVNVNLAAWRWLGLRGGPLVGRGAPGRPLDI